MSDELYQSVIQYMTTQSYPKHLTKAEKRKVRQAATGCIVDDEYVLDANNPYKPYILKVIPLSSKKFSVSWRDMPQSYHNFATHVELFTNMADISLPVCKTGAPVQSWHMYGFSCGMAYAALPVSGECYVIEANFIRAIEVNGQTYKLILGKGTGFVQSTFNLSELYQLRAKAVAFLNGKKQVVNVLYRNRPAAYFEDILLNHRGNMIPYKKDFNGDPASPINGTVDGLFFSANTLKKGKLPHYSPFGDTRFIIPAYRLVNANKNLYFADFYCHYERHYVTIVVTTPNSNTDLFCKSFLPTLDALDNPFLWFENGQLFIGSDVLVEIYYTDLINIHIEKMNTNCRFTRVSGRVGKGVSSAMGIRKRQDCKICNLYKSIV